MRGIVGKYIEEGLEGTDLAQYFFADQSDVKELYKHHGINYVVFMGSLESAHDVY